MRHLIAFLLAAAVSAAPAAAGQAGGKALILWVSDKGCGPACAAFEATIADSGFPAEIVRRDLGQEATGQSHIVQEARAVKADLVVTLGGHAARGVIGTLDDIGDRRFLQQIPAVFAVNGDPFANRIAEGAAGSGRLNVAGIYDLAPLAVSIETIRRFDPGFHRLGLLYNANEREAAATLQELNRLAPSLGIELLALDIEPGTSEAPDPALIPVRLAELAEMGVTWVIQGSSPFLRAHGSLFTASAVAHGIAVVSRDETLVREHQAFLSIAARGEELGRLAAEQALKILRDGLRPGDLPILQAGDFAPLVNLEVAARLDRLPPEDLLRVTQTVGD